MTSRRWLTLTALTIAGIVSIHLLVAYELDVYGILRNPAGRELATSIIYAPMTDDRVFKYMANRRYVSANFDSLIIGSSSSENWYPEFIHGYHFYDEAVIGGKASEEKIITDQLPPDAHLRIAICALSPYIVAGHELRHGLGDVSRREAYGSINLLSEEIAKVMTILHLRPKMYFADGSHRFPEKKHLDQEDLGPSYYDIDPKAMADYRALVLNLQAHGAKIIYVAPPVYQPLFGDLSPIHHSLELMLAELPPGPIIDFNSEPEFADFIRDPNNFTDDVHVNDFGAERVSRTLDQRLHILTAAANGALLH